MNINPIASNVAVPTSLPAVDYKPKLVSELQEIKHTSPDGQYTKNYIKTQISLNQDNLARFQASPGVSDRPPEVKIMQDIQKQISLYQKALTTAPDTPGDILWFHRPATYTEA